MRIDGDIRVWTDGRKVCARLYADGPEGPIIVQAAAPLGPIKRTVARMFARRGVSVSGSDAAYKATVQHLARKKALRRLKRLAPRAFKRGGLAPYLATRELARRRRLRQALERTGQSVGPKALGPVPAGARGPRLARRARKHARFVRGRGLPGAPALAPVAAAAALTAPARALLPASSASTTSAPAERHGGAGARPGDGRDEEADSMNNEREDEGAEAEPVETNSPPEGSEAERAEGPGDEGAEDAGDEPGEDPGEGDVEDDDAAVSGEASVARERRNEALRRAMARRRLRAALAFLRAARHDPRARRRLRQIATLAGEGDPKARKVVKTLVVANKIGKRRAAAGMRRAPGKAIVPRPKRLAPPPASPKQLQAAVVVPAPAPVPASQAERFRWWDILAAWRRGMG
ncbi:MAG: hypothetical protein SFX73_08445 [Kofleriaceae bacterium]|nr:hypothetical protein [Kofleriaceae bacterium]